MALVEIINLNQVDTKLLEVLANFMLQISDKHTNNWQLIYNYCEKLGQDQLKSVNQKLVDVMRAMRPPAMIEDEDQSPQMIELVRQISNTDLSLQRKESNKQEKEAIEMTQETEQSVKKMLTQSCEELSSVQNVFKVYA